MNRRSQEQKARLFLEFHHRPELLVLPNIWDPSGARMLESLGYPAVATASAAVAYSLGLADGERIDFATMLGVIDGIASSVDVPVSADVERGYAESPSGVAENVREVLRAGAVGINLEDGLFEGGPLRPIESQCERIGAVRDMARQEGVPLVINARIDVFMEDSPASREEKIAETIKRASAYIGSGADCIYPILAGDLATLVPIRDATRAPINVYASASTAPMRELEAAGMSRLSVGPGLLRASLTAMKRAAEQLKRYGSYELFTDQALSSAEIRDLVVRDD